MSRIRKIRVHIALVNGEWYAQSGNNNYATRCALVPAISFCDRLNAKQKRGKSHAARMASRAWAVRQDNRTSKAMS